MLRSLLLLASLSSFSSCWSSAFASELVLPGRIERVVAAGDLVAVIRGEQVRVLSDDGRPLLYLGHARDSSDAGDNPRASEQQQQDLLDLYDIPEHERDSDYAERLVEDETTLRDRRAARLPRAHQADGRAHLLAASETNLWILAGRTLWRVDLDGLARPVSTLLPRFAHLSAANGRLLAAAGSRLWFSNDDGASFLMLADADTTVRAVATGDTAVAWATHGQLSWIEGDRLEPRSLSLPAPPRDLRFCGRTLLVLHEHGLLAVAPDGSTTALAHDVQARRLECGAALVALAGPGLLVSLDEGRTFAERGQLAATPILDVALGGRCVWIATEVGLYCLPPRAPAPALFGGLLAPEEAPDQPPRLRERTRERARWATMLPQLAIAALAVTAPGRQQLSAGAFAEFGLGAPVTTPVPRTSVLLAQAAVPEPAPEAPVMSRPTISPGPDRDARCLPLTRVEAVSRMLAEPERARSYVARAGHAAWLPELRVRVDRRLGRSESLDLPTSAGAAPGPLGLDTANDVRYEARATWDLSKLVFSTEEIAAANQALRMADMRREVESLANRLYFERRRLKMELLLSPPADVARARRELRVQELEAELDVLSGGAFTRCLPAPP